MDILLPTTKEVLSIFPQMTWKESIITILKPVCCVILYFTFFHYALYPLALFSVVYLSFITYGSSSHELVHSNTKFSETTSRNILSIIELIMLRSGTVYKHVHLNHHKKFPDFNNDPEGQASYFSLFRTLLEGPILHFKLIKWALKNNKEVKRIYIEIFLIFTFILIGISLINEFPQLLIFQALVYLGSWIIPLITSYLVHLPHEKLPIYQTRVYRGIFFRILAQDHLYHLEHHLYPKVPYQRWPKLASFLNPYLMKTKIIPKRLGINDNDVFDIN